MAVYEQIKNNKLHKIGQTQNNAKVKIECNPFQIIFNL